MGKKKRSRELATTEAPVAERHGFDSAGMLGHDGTYAVNVNEQTALGVDAVFACVRILADLTADAAIGEYRGNERLPDSRLTRRPMGSITRRTWLWNVTATMALYNGCYLYSALGNDAEGVAVSLLPVAPPRVTWLDPRTPQIDAATVDVDKLRWIPRMSFPTLTRELSWTLRLARETIAAAASADAYRTGFWESGGTPQLWLISDQLLNGDQAAAIRDAYMTARAANPGAPGVLGQGTTPTNIGADMGAAGATDVGLALGSSVARYFGVPAWMLNVPTHAGSLTYSVASAAGLDLVRYTLQPGYAGPIGDAWSDELPGDYLGGRRVVLDLAHLTRGTQLEQAQAYTIATGAKPWMLPSEVRTDLHMPVDMTLDDAGTPAPAMEAITDGTT